MNKATAIVFATIAIGCAQVSLGQIFNAGNEKPNSEFIPRSAVTGMALFPAKLAANPDFKAFPHEVVTAWGKKELGFDPMLISEVTLLLKRMDEFPLDREQPGWAAILHFEKMQGLSGRMIDELEQKRVGGKTVYSGGPDRPSFLIFDESTIIVGNETWFGELITNSGQGKLVEMFNAPEVHGQMMTFCDVKQMRPMFAKILTEFDKFELPTQISDFREIPDLVDSLEIGIDLDRKVAASLVVHAKNSESATRVSDIMVEGMQFGKVAMLAQMANQFDMNDPVEAATVAYARRVAEKYESKLTPTIDGTELTITLNEEVIAIPFLLGMVGSSTRSMQFERKMTPTLQLRSTSLAALNYESAYTKFPSTTINDETGKPLFSGQVAMLPFLEQNNLYQNLRLDEPWDSEHNKQFTSMVIPIFGMAPNGGANIRFPVFPGSMWDDGGGISIGEISDGTSNTILAIQAPDDAAASWADPTPWKISETNPMRDVFGDRDEVFVAMVDGSSLLLKRDEMTNDKLKAMLTIDGGEIVRRD